MIEVRRDLQGQVVDKKYPLQKYLGGTEHSTVFLTEYQNGRSQKAAIKLVEALPGHAEAQLIRWRLAAKFAHPNLLRIFEMDRAKLDGASMLYVVMEYAEENLSDTLIERPLSLAEAREMVGPMLEALGYIHSKGFVHGHIQPSNIMAIGDQLKLSSDGISRISESSEWRSGVSRYSAPECASSGPTPASDVWSLGVTLATCLNELWPKPQGAAGEEILLPADLPTPFLELVRHCLVADPQRRWTIPQIKARLERKPSVEAEVEPPAPEQKAANRRYGLAAGAFAIVAAAILAGTILFHRGSSTGATSVAHSQSAVAEAKVIPTSAPPTPAAKPVRAAVNAAARSEVHAAPRVSPAQPILASTPVRGEVIHRVLPNVPREASDTIWGTVRVRVRVSVDPSGGVIGAKFDWPGPSRYFARLSMAAAQGWKFRAPSVNGNNMPSEWLIRFGYTKSGTNATAAEQKP